MNKAFFDTVQKAQADGEPVAVYRKAIVGKVVVSAIDIYSGDPVDLVLAGNPFDSNEDREDYVIVLWTDFEHDYFRRANKQLFKIGYIVPTTLLETEEKSINEITDAELEEILSKPFFSLRAFLEKVTSDVPVRRILHMAEEQNKTVGTIDAIKARLSELQAHPEV